MTTWSIFTGAGAPALSPPTPPPSTSVSFAGPIVIGSEFQVTAGSLYLAGCRYWVADANGNHGPQEFALWQAFGGFEYSLIASGTVTSGAFTTGAWNTVTLPTPIPLTQGINYLALTGFTGGFNFTSPFWASGGAGTAGLVNGPLHFWSDGMTPGTNPDPYNNPQSAFSTNGGDPTVTTPNAGDAAFNGWVDVIVTDQPPASPTYRLWPSMPVAENAFGTASDSATIATQLSVSAPATVANIWHYSPANATALPTRCGIWSVAGQAAILDVTSPAWSGAAGSGWVSCTNLPAGTQLAAGTQYKVASSRNASGDIWFQAYEHYWTSGGPGASGRSNGILTAPASAGASPGQGSFSSGGWAYPSSTDAEGYWVDLEVAPSAAAPAGSLLLACFP